MNTQNRTIFQLLGALLSALMVMILILTTANAKPTQQEDCAEYVTNGDFEEDGGWLWFPFSGIGRTDAQQRSGQHSVYLNTVGATTSLTGVRLPSLSEKPTSVQLTFYYYETQFNINEPLHVVISNTTQQPLWDITLILAGGDKWQQKTFDIPTHSLTNEELLLAFALIHDDDTEVSHVYIDDVSLKVCPSTLQPLPTPTPSNIPTNLPTELMSISQFMESTDLADWDGDGDLDRVQGSHGHNRIYEYDTITNSWQEVWKASISDRTWNVAWGDWDGDGDPDLAVGNFGQPNYVYENKNGVLDPEPVWISAEEDYTVDLAWGDYDNDGDLDLAVGNAGQVNRVYENEGGEFSIGWEAPEESLQKKLSYTVRSFNFTAEVHNLTTSIAWGDVNGDGLLDLAIGNLGFNQLYHNQGDGQLGDPEIIDPVPELASLKVSGVIPQATTSVAWGDWDGDGDLDLAAGNFTYQNDQLDNLLQDLDEYKQFIDISGLKSYDNRNLIYENVDGKLTLDPHQKIGWLFQEHNETTGIAWADWENQGKLGLAVGNLGFNQIYYNDRRLCEEDGITYRQHQRMEQVWRSPEVNISWGVQWGDIDANGLLDLYSAELFTDRDIFKPNPGRLEFISAGVALCDPGAIEADGVIKLTKYPTPGPFGWAEPDDHRSLTYDMAWGDINQDGSLDVVYGNKGTANRIYLNNGGQLEEKPELWAEPPPDDMTYAVVLGDLDGDGDLDLVIGNEVGENRLYYYENDKFHLQEWDVARDDTYSLALGDWDNDSDLDLAVGNAGQNYVYENVCENNSCVLRLDDDYGWRSEHEYHTRSMAWGDWDNDGDLDLAVGNLDSPNFVYENVRDTLHFNVAENRGWQSDDELSTYALDWGDWDGDGDLDLAVGNFADYNQVFENDAGTLHLDIENDLGWQSPEQLRTTNVDWGDSDNDNDLDLLVANFGDPDIIYANQDGTLFLAPEEGQGWRSDNKPLANDITWVDWDNDGDIDLAYAIHGNTNHVAENYTRDRGLLPDVPPVVSIATIGNAKGTPRADFQATSVLLEQQIIPIEYTLADSNSNPVSAIRAFYSLDRGGTWIPATHTADTALTNLIAPSEGITHTYHWDAEADGIIYSNSVVFRLEASQGYGGGGPYQVAYSSAQSYPFQVQAAEVFARVVDASNDAVADALLFVDGEELLDANGEPIMTDSAGLARLDETDVGKSIVALAPVDEYTSTRAAHDGWAYRTYLTSQTWVDDVPQAMTIGESGEQRLIISDTNPLVLFNLVVSIEWDATAEYIEQIRSAIEISATDYLYDLSDGQMALGAVAIYDDSEMWADADIQILARNNVRPHATVGGIFDLSNQGAIRVGRLWDGNTANQGRWDQPNGYRTIVHELGHYGLGLYDEYIGVLKNASKTAVIGFIETSCTGNLSSRNPAKDATNASAMDYHYTASEFSDHEVDGLWIEENCKHTLQMEENKTSPWHTIVGTFSDPNGSWSLKAPSDRGRIVPGPDSFPHDTLGLPHVTISNPVTSENQVVNLSVVTEECRFGGDEKPGCQAIPNAIVVLYKEDGTRLITQGITDQHGRIELYGAYPGDEVRVTTMDGIFSGSGTVPDMADMKIYLRSN